MTKSPIHVYTDGACSGNPGPGGWAWAVEGGPSDRGAEVETTNQRMELTAVMEALRALEGPVTVHSDSTYVVNCFNDRWYEGWLRRGWRNANRKPVANQDLWQPVVEMFQRRRDELDFVWVKGHSGDPMNDLVDALAVEAWQELVGRNEAGSTATRAGDGPASSTGPEPPWPPARAVVVTGRGDADQDGLDELAQVVSGLRPDTDIVVSGLRRGPELSGAEAALRVGVPLAVVLPFANPAARWSPRDRDRFDRCLHAAGWVVELEGDVRNAATALKHRNAWLWRSALGAIVVADDALVHTLERDHDLAVIALPHGDE